MKRMIFIRTALSVTQGGLKALLVLAAMTFMGTVSVSAQSYFTPSQASAVTEATLMELSQQPVAKSGAPNATLVGAPSTIAQAPTVNDNSRLLVLKIAYLSEVGINLKMGLGTQEAIDQVYNTASNGAPAARLTLLGQAKAYVVDLLSN